MASSIIQEATKATTPWKRKVIVFDLDNTLAPNHEANERTFVPNNVLDNLVQLHEYGHIVIILTKLKLH